MVITMSSVPSLEILTSTPSAHAALWKNNSGMQVRIKAAFIGPRPRIFAPRTTGGAGQRSFLSYPRRLSGSILGVRIELWDGAYTAWDSSHSRRIFLIPSCANQQCGRYGGPLLVEIRSSGASGRMGGAERLGGGLRRPGHESSVLPANRGAGHRRQIHPGLGARHSL